MLNEEQIYELYVVQKLSCKEVAERLSINYNSLKSYLHRNHISQTYTKKCLNCNKEFETKRSNGKFCSDECYKQYTKDNYSDYKYKNLTSGYRICEQCGKEYYYSNSSPVYAKNNHHISAYRFCSYDCGIKNSINKGKQTNLERYGTECSLNNADVRTKAVNTLRKKYNVDKIGKAKEIRDKIKRTCKERYGAENVLSKESSIYKDIQEAVFEKYGVENVFQSDEIKERIKRTNLERYGTEYAASSKEIRAKYNHAVIQSKIFETKKKNGTLSSSNFEKEVREYVKSLGLSVEKYLLGKGDTRFEIDVYIPELRIGIECNGCWWHSYPKKAQRYHYNKYLTAKDKNIDLICVWEDQWIHKQDIIKDILKARLNCISDDRIYARKCKIKEINNTDYKLFCENNHIQGYRPAKIRFGLYYNDKLVQIASFNECKDYGRRKSQAEYEWIRGCIASNNVVIGGTSRLLKHFIKTYSPKSILCYADANLFNGKGYSESGFVFDGYTGPDKFYIENNTFKRYGRNPYKYTEFKEAVKKGKYFECYGVGSLKFMWRSNGI